MMRSAIFILLILLATVARGDDTLRVGMYGLPKGLGNPYSSTSISEMYTWAAIFDGLTRIDTDGKVHPALAIGWQHLDELTWVFDLRRGVTFSNGEPMNADAVIQAIEYLTSEEAAGESVAREFTAIAGAKALSEHQVEIRTHVPTAILPAMTAGLRIVAPNHWRKLGPKGFAQDPVGTGPYYVERWEPAKVTLRAFKDSWQPPSIERLEILQVLDVSTRLQALQSGKLDIALNISPDDLAAVARSGATGRVERGNAVVGMSFIMTKESPVQLQKVRQALNYAVNKEAITEVLLGGHAIPAGQPAAHYITGYDPNLKPYPYDPDKARALLAEAGYPDGFDMVVEVVTSGSIAAAAIYGFLKQQFAQVGVEMEIRSLPVSQLITKAVTGTFSGEAFGMEFDFTPTLDAMAALPMHSCQRRIPWYCNREAMPIIEAAQREFDPQRRTELLQEVMRYYHEDPAMVYIYEAIDVAGVAGRINDYASTNGVIDYSTVAFR